MNTTYDNTLECAFNSSDIHSLISKHWPHVLTLLTNHWDATTKFLDMRAHLEKYPFNVPKIMTEYLDRGQIINIINQFLASKFPPSMTRELGVKLFEKYEESADIINRKVSNETPYIISGRLSNCCTEPRRQWLWSCGYEMSFNTCGNECFTIDGVLHVTVLHCDKRLLDDINERAGENYEAVRDEIGQTCPEEPAYFFKRKDPTSKKTDRECSIPIPSDATSLIQQNDRNTTDSLLSKEQIQSQNVHASELPAHISCYKLFWYLVITIYNLVICRCSNNNEA